MKPTTRRSLFVLLAGTNLKRRALYLSCAVLTVSCLGMLLKGARSQPASNTWAAVGNVTAIRTGAASALQPDGRVLITGGTGSSGALATTEFFNVDGSVSSLAPMMYPRSGHTSVALLDGRVLVAGGVNNGGELSVAEIYDPATNRWQPVGNLLTARSRHTTSRLPDGRVLFVGGQSAGVALATLEIFDPASSTFEPVSELLSSPRLGHAAAVLKNGRVLLAGGTDGTNVLATADLFDPTTGAVSPVGKLTTARTGHTATTLLDGRVFLAGGSDGSADLASTEIYDPATGAFSPAGSLAAARKDHLAFRIPNNNSVLIAGGSFNGAALSSSELYIPWTGAFKPAGTLAAARLGSAGSPLKQPGMVMMAAGSTSGSVEVFSGPTVMTDKADYAPGETVTITGTGWQPGENVVLHFVESPLIDTHPDLTAVADAGGNIFNNQFSPDHYDIGITFTLTATGQSSGLTAQTTFTDAELLTAELTGTVNDVTVAQGSSASFSISVNASGAIACSVTSGTPSTATVRTSYAISAAGVVSSSVPSGNLNFFAATPCTGTNGTITWTGDPTVYSVTASVSANAATPVGTYTISLSTAAGTTTVFNPNSTGAKLADDVVTSIAVHVVAPANTAPVVTAAANQSSNEGENHSFSMGSFTDEAGDTPWNVSVNWGDLSAATTLSMATAGTIPAQSHTYADGPNTYTVTVSVTDKNGGAGSLTGSATFQATVNNVAPTVAFTSPTTPVNEGDTKTYNFSITDPGDDTFSFVGTPSCGANGTLTGVPSITGSTGSFQCLFPDGPADTTLSVQVQDSDGAPSNTPTTGVHVNNVAPTVAVTGPSTADEGQTKTYTFTVTDPGQDTFTVLAGFPNCGTGGNYVGGSLTTNAGGGSFNCSFPDGPASPTVQMQVKDSDDENSNVGNFAVTVNNVAPTVAFSSPATSANEGDTVVFNFNITDPGQDSFTVAASSCGAQATVQGSNITGNTGTLTCKFLDGPSTQTVTIQVNDGDPTNNLSNTASTDVAVANLAPTVAFTSPTTPVNEGSTVTYNFSISDPGDDTLSFVGTPSCGTGGTPTGVPSITGSTGSFQCTFPDGPADTTLSVQVQDSDGAPSNTATTGVHVNNVAPTVAVSGPATANEGETKTYTFTVTDPGQDTFTVLAGFPNCGTGGNYVGGSLTTNAGGGSFNCSFPDGPASPTVQMQVKDSDNDNSNVGSFAVTVYNVVPIATLSNNGPVNEGSPATITFGGQFDPSPTDTLMGFHYAYSCTNASLAGAAYVGSGTSASTNCTFNDNGTYTVNGRIIDKDGGYNEYTTVVTVNNLAPAVSSLNANLNPVEVNQPTTTTLNFSDPGTGDTHTCAFTWDDPNSALPPTGTVNETNGAGSCFATHTFTQTGVYSVNVIVTDDDGASTSTTILVAVYDPNAGFVTGGGWINSPAGAMPVSPFCSTCTTLTGKANFGFNSKYKKGQSVPDGQTEFQFQVGNVNFHSMVYQWLVVSGAKAQFKGYGTINGTGNYGFLLTANDGKNGGDDKFRIKIWDVATSLTVYDNNLGGSDDIDSANPQIIGGGSIVIHSN